MTIKEALIGAKARIEAGWMQGEYYSDDKSKVCAVGAVSLTTEKEFFEDEAYAALLLTVLDLYPNYSTVSDFNDDYTTTKAMVLDLFDVAIERCVHED